MSTEPKPSLTDTHEIRTTGLTVCPPGAGMHDKQATTVRLADEGGGEYVRVSQDHHSGEFATICISPEEWPALRAAIDRMIASCRGIKP